MAENHSGEERTERASPKRLKEARERGDVVRSRELNTMLLLLAAAAGFLMLGRGMTTDLLGLMVQSFSIDRELLEDPHWLAQALASAAVQALLLLAPFFLLMTIIALLAPMLLGGWAFSAEALSLKFERINPTAGFKRIFSVKGLAELIKASIKFVLIGSVAIISLGDQFEQLMQIGHGTLKSDLGMAGERILLTFLLICASTAIIAAVDVPFQLWDHGKRLKMSRQEVKDEMKETEGKPEVRARIRGMQQEIASRRMMAEVPRADVIITNPTHYAIALRYDQASMDAPRLVAKGVDEVAQRIKAIGQANHIPLYEAPLLARALYRSTRLNQTIPAGLYLAVAQVLAYVFQLRKDAGMAQVPPHDLPIPDEFLKADK